MKLAILDWCTNPCYDFSWLFGYNLMIVTYKSHSRCTVEKRRLRMGEAWFNLPTTRRRMDRDFRSKYPFKTRRYVAGTTSLGTQYESLPISLSSGFILYRGGK